MKPILCGLLCVILGCEGRMYGTGSTRAPVDPALALESGSRRLSRAELDRTLEDLLGDDTSPATRVLAEDEFVPYDNDYTTQQASQALIASLEILAQDVAERAMADGARRA